MTIITPAPVFPKALQEKTYGIVKFQGRMHVRNYGRVLKNGRGMTFWEAYYMRVKTEFVDLFLPRNEAPKDSDPH